MPADLHKARELFLHAVGKLPPEGWDGYVAEACGGDADLLQQVGRLLEVHREAGSFLDVPAIEQVAAGFSQPDDPTVAMESNAAGAEIAARENQPDLAVTQDEGQGDNDEIALEFLQPSAKPGSLGRLGHYEVLEVLGQGGFGVVLKAFDEMLHRVVAVKVMAPRLASTSPARKRFLREARAAARVCHENVVQIYAVEEQPTPYLVMEYIAGQTLQQRLDQAGPFGTSEVLRLGQQVAGGLAAAHARGLIHRDVKPANILLEAGVESRVKVTDFGLARAADDASLTQSGYIAGTPMYMAPEQAQGEAMDHRADLFSLGSVLYVMCTGRPPFRASTTLAVLKRVAEDAPRPIREIIPEVPEWLCALIAKLHAKKPADRLASAKEVADLLGRCLSELQQPGGGQPSPLIPPATAEPAAVASEPIRSAPPPTSETAAAGKSGKRRPWLVALAEATAVLAVLGLIGLLLVQTFRPPRGEPATDPKAPVVFQVQANQVWQDTGVDVIEGEAVVLAPKGAWRKGQQMCSAGGLEQAPREGAAYPEAPLLCLLVRIGDEPTPTPVGRREVFKPKRSGRLFVQANDLALESDSDSLQLTVTGGLHIGDAAPPPELLPVQAAERDWQPLLARSEAPGVNPEPVRDAVFDYCLKYAGTPQAFRAGRLLLKLPPLVNSIGMKLAPIPPGKFLMGSPDNETGRRASEGPQHEVVLTRPFYMSVYDVTVGQFKVFSKETGYLTDAEKGIGDPRLFPDGTWKNDPEATWLNPGFEQTDDHPVVCVSWNDANAFCSWLSDKEGKKYDLPTEAQWEYACRAGSQTKFYFGNDDDKLDQYGWYIANSQNQAHPVGQKKPNAWGLYDMHGNVWQWIANYYLPDYYQKSPREDPPGPGPSPNGSHLLCGASWHGDVGFFSAARRVCLLTLSPSADVGFRVVRLR
jgi:formylglycine-generating enzyme required for sulfatase activity/serine/threonine protein kinase